MVRPVPLVPGPARWLLVGLVVVGILAASVVPTGAAGQTTGPLGVGADKYLHALGYAVLALALAYAMAGWRPRIAAVAAFAVAVAFGFGVELVQFPLAYRRFSRLDLAADAAGASAVALGWGVFGHRLRFQRVQTGHGESVRSDP